MRTLTLISVLGFLLVGQANASGLAEAGEIDRFDRLPEPPGYAVLNSTTRRFLAGSANAAQGLRTLLFAEEVTERLERLMGRSLPARPGNPLRIRLHVDEQVETAMIARSRTGRGLSSVQRILVVNPDQSDPEEFLEALVAELLDRFAWARQDPAAAPAATHSLPDWIAVGVAQDLYRVLRARNHALLRRYTLQGEVFPLHQWIEPAEAHANRPLSRAFRGAAFGWLRSRPRFAVEFDAWMQRLARGEASDPDLLLRAADLSNGDGRELEIEWQLWLAAQTSVLRDWGRADPVDIEELNLRLRVPARAVPGADPDAGRWITPESLVRHREEPWARAGAGTLRRSLRRLAGNVRGEEFRDVVHRFDAVLADVARPPRGGRWRGFAAQRRGPSTGELEERLHEAREALAAVETSVRTRSWIETDPGHHGHRGRSLPEEAREELRRHLDAWEEKADDT